MVTAFVALAAGIVLARCLPLGLVALAVLAAACAAALILGSRRRFTPLLLSALVLGLIGAAGALDYTIQTSAARGRARAQLSALLQPHTGTLCRLSGVVDGEVMVALVRDPLAGEAPETDPDPTARDGPRHVSTFRLRVDKIETNGRVVATAGAVRVSVDGVLTHTAHGDRVCVLGWASPLDPDRDRYAASRGFVARLSVQAPEAVQVERPGPRSFWRTLYTLKRRFRAQIENRLNENAADIAKVLLLGDHEQLGDRLNRAFNQSGTTHVLSISGLHVGILYGVVFWLCRMLLAPSWLRRALVLTIVICYGATTGLGPATIRSVLMIILFETAEVLRFYREPLNAVAAAGLAILLVAPQNLFEAGFQLTFLGVAGIVLFASPIARALHIARGPLERFEQPEFQTPWRRRLRTAWAYIARALAASIAACLAVAPVQAYYFDIVTPVSILATAALIPVIALFTSLGFAFLALSSVPLLSSALAAVLSGLAFAFTSIVRLAADIPFGHVFLGGPSPAWILLFYAALVVLAARRWLRLPTGYAAAVPLAVLCAFLACRATVAPPREFAAAFLNVGHGSCTIITRGRHAVVFDCGSGGPMSARDVGAGPAAHELWRLGVRRIDLIVLSHSHLDHVCGVLSLAERFPIGLVLVNPTFEDDPIRRDQKGHWLIRELDARGVRHQAAAAGDRVSIGDVDIEFLWPPPPTPTSAPIWPPRGDAPWRLANVNDRSLVARVRCADRSVLLPGDIESPAMAALLATHTDLNAELLAVPHHGGEDEPPLPHFIRAVGPGSAVISEENIEHSPSASAPVVSPPRPLAGFRIYRTCLYGTLRFLATPDGWHLESSR